MKKIISLFLSLALASSMMTAAVHAADEANNFIEDFSGYSESNAPAHSADTKVTSKSGTAQEVASTNDRQILLSGINVGYTPQNAYGYGYVDVAQDTFVLGAAAQQYVTANFNFTQRGVKSIKHFEFTAATNLVGSWDSLTAMRTHVSADEKTYIEFGTAHDTDIYKPSAAKKFSPYILIVDGNNSSNSKLVACETQWSYKEDATVTWSIDFDAENNTISATATKTNGDTWSTIVSLSGTTLSALEQTMKYPFAAAVRGPSGNGVGYNNIKAKFEYGSYAPNFTDNFSSYTAENTPAHDAATKLTSKSGIEQEITSANGYQILMSGVNIGYQPQNSFGYGYIDVAKDMFVLGAAAQQYVTANFNFNQRSVTGIKHFEFTSSSNLIGSWDSLTAMRTHVSPDEKSYIEFGTVHDTDLYKPSGTVRFSPYIYICDAANGNSETFVCDTQWNYKEDATVAWSIDFNTESNTISVSATKSNGNSWTTTVSPSKTTLSAMEQNMKYPFAAATRGPNGNGVGFGDIKAKLEYGRIPSTFFDAFDVYSSKNSAAYSEITKLSAAAGKQVEIGRIADHKLILTGSGSGTGSAHIDTAGNTLVAEDNNNNTEVKYYFPKGTDSVKSLEFKSTVSGVKGGVRAFENASGTSYVEFGTNSANNTPYVTIVDGNTVKSFVPSWTGTSREYTWTADIDGSTIEVNAAGTDGNVWSENITYDGLSAMISALAYPFAVFADGSGKTTVSYINSALSVKEYEPTFFEDFSGYTQDNTIAYSADTKLSGIKLTPQTIAEKSDRKWILSGMHVGDYDGGHIGSAYLDIADGILNVTDSYARGTTANLEIKNTDYEWISEISFDSYYSGARYGIMALVNDTEDEYYVFATGRDYMESDTVTDSDGNSVTNNVKKQTPYFAKFKYGKAVYISSPDSLWGVNSTHWSISFEDGKIIWTATSGDKTWSEVYSDAELGRIMDNTVYPVAAYSHGDTASKIDNLSIFYGKKNALCTDNGDGTLTISVSPYSYKHLLSSGYMSVVTAYYSDDDELVYADIHKVTDMYNPTEYTLNKTENSSVRGKIFVLDGSVISNRQLGSNSEF